MNNKPTFDRSILIPISLAGFSVIGIVMVLLIGRTLTSPPQAPVSPSPTPFEYLYLATEPAVTTPLGQGSEIAPTEDLSGGLTEGPPSIATTPVIPSPIILTQLNTNTPTSAVQRTNTPASPTSTSASGPPLNPGVYDDVDSHLIYKGWNPPATVAGAYGNTLHVSVEPGSTLTFRFIGRELRLIYQGGSTLGQMSITIDNQSYTLNEFTGNEWVSLGLPNATHSVLITHVGGGSVNLDQVIIPEISNTPTPTRTSTLQP